MRVMLDTNAFNYVMDEEFDLDLLPPKEYFVTNIQKAELARTSDADRKARLLDTFAIVAHKTNTARVFQNSTPWGSPWDQGGKYFADIFSKLEKVKPSRGNKKDAIMIETCKYNRLVFVSNDENARDVCAFFKVESISARVFFETAI